MPSSVTLEVMKYAKFLLVFALFLVVYAWYVHQEAPQQTKDWQEVVQYAEKNLPLEGELRQKSDGFVYLKVDDVYIHKLLPMLEIQQKGFREPSYFRQPEAPGAHISVFYADEEADPDEVGQTFHFYPKQIKVVRASKTTRYVVLQVDAPELEKLREKYGYSPKVNGHEYHITLGVKVKR